MRRTLTVTALSVLFIIVSLSVLPSGTLLKEVKAQSKPSTTITAVDGNNAPVQNLGTTTSHSIIWKFTTTGGVPPYTYTCTVKDLGIPPVTPCFSGFEGFDLPTGQHELSVLTVDTKGEESTSFFVWTIVTNTPPPPLTPIQATQQLIQLKHSMHLAAGTDTALDSQLNAAIQYFQNNIKTGACIHLSGFTAEVQTFLQVGKLTKTQASQLLQGVQSVERIAGC
jgi:hypothetical protein